MKISKQDLEKLSNISSIKSIREGILISFVFNILITLIFIPIHYLNLYKIKPLFNHSLDFLLGLLAFSLTLIIPLKFLIEKKRNLLEIIIITLINLQTLIFLFKLNNYNISIINIEKLSKGGFILGFFLAFYYLILLIIYQKTKLNKLNLIIYTIIINFLLLFLKKYLIKINIFSLINLLFNYLLIKGDNLISAIIIVFWLNFLYFLGIYSPAIIGPIITPFYLILLKENAQAVLNNLKPQHITNIIFFYLPSIGGVGATLGLVINMLFSKKEKLKKLAKISIIPSLFNINEPLLFGLPIFFEFEFLIPFISLPILFTIINYFAFKNICNKLFILLPPFIPTPLLAYISSGGDIKILIITIIEISISIIIYYPFLKNYEKKL